MALLEEVHGEKHRVPQKRGGARLLMGRERKQPVVDGSSDLSQRQLGCSRLTGFPSWWVEETERGLSVLTHRSRQQEEGLSHGCYYSISQGY